MSLTVCTITRNAEGHLERALRSVADLGAEVIVADTGSTDRTVDIARAQGATVHAVNWQDDFGAAQNEALDQAHGDWIFWLNPDEELLPQAKEQLPALLARPEALVYVLRVQEQMSAAEPQRFTEVALPRLFRRHPELRFVGRLHPHFIVPPDEVARREQKQILPASLVVRHHGYLSELTPDKLRWATRLLELELADRPGQLHYLIEYGRNLLRLNDAKGHEVLAQAAEQVWAAREAARAPLATVGSLLEYLLSVATQHSKSTVSAEQARDLALRWFADSPPLLWAMAQRAFVAGKFQEAAGLLEKLVLLGRTGAFDRSAAFDPNIMAEPAVLNLGRCYVQSGDLDRAELRFGQLLASPTHQAEARQGYALVQRLRQQPPPK